MAARYSASRIETSALMFPGYKYCVLLAMAFAGSCGALNIAGMFFFGVITLAVASSIAPLIFCKAVTYTSTAASSMVMLCLATEPSLEPASFD